MTTSFAVLLLLFSLQSFFVQSRRFIDRSIDKNQVKVRRRTPYSDRFLQTGVPYKVELLLALDYVNKTVAHQFESSETTPTTNATSYFCYAVNRQSSGNQVAYSAALIGATIETRYVDSNSTGDDSQCSILGTNRNYDVNYNFTAQDLFRLELSIGQIVYVQSNASTLSLKEVTSIIETGFSRGEGGRLRFRALLAPNPYFRTVVNVEVLNGLPQPTAPVGNVTVAPSDRPVQKVPSKTPTHFPTISSTTNPTIIISSMPSLFPSTSPMKYPSNTPVYEPTSKLIPTSTPTIPPTAAPSVNTSPSVPLSPAGPTVESFTPTINYSPSKSSTTTPDTNIRTIVGGVIGGFGFVLATVFFVFCVWLPFCASHKNGGTDSQDNASGSFPGQGSVLTPTTISMTVPGVLTLDDDAQSLANTTLDGKSSAPIFSTTQDTETPRPIQTDESFDESSIYTSTTDPTSAIARDSIQVSSSVIDASSVGGNENFTYVSQQEQRSSLTKTNGTNRPESKEFDPFEEENEHFADDELSLVSGNSLLHSQIDTLLSNDTKRYEHVTISDVDGSHTVSYKPDNSGKTYDEVNGETNGPSQSNLSVELEKSKFPVVNLLEQFFSETFNNVKLNASKSVSSLQSAPSRLVAPAAIKEHPTIQPISGHSPQYRHRRVVTDNSPSFRSRILHSKSKIIDISNSDHPLVAMSISTIGESSNIEGNHVSNIPISSGFDDPFLSEFVGLQMPSTDSNPDSNEKWSHVAPRLPLSVSSDRDETGSATMNSSRYGNYSSAESMYDSSSVSGRSGSWQFDTDDHTLDSDSRLGSFQSTGSWSSRVSKTSAHSAERLHLSTRGTTKTLRPERIRQNGMYTSNSLTNGSRQDEQKSADHAAGPYSRLSALGNYGTSSMSGSSASGSGSRSTLSTRMESQYKEQHEVLAPPGKINIVLVTDFHNGNGTVISKVRSTSTLQGKLREGDELVAIDGDDVSNMVIAEITEIMASRAGRERKLTILRDPSSILERNDRSYQEAKHEGSP